MKRYAYADPPYIGQANRHYQCDEIDHAQLVATLCVWFPDGWALSTGNDRGTLRTVLNLCPPDVRVMAWVKPWCSFKPGVNPAYAWEPVIVGGGRLVQGTRSRSATGCLPASRAAAGRMAPNRRRSATGSSMCSMCSLKTSSSTSSPGAGRSDMRSLRTSGRGGL